MLSGRQVAVAGIVAALVLGRPVDLVAQNFDASQLPESQYLLDELPRRSTGRWELALGIPMLPTAVLMVVVGAMNHGPSWFCGSTWDDEFGSGSEDCPPRKEGGPFFGAAAILGVAGITLVVLGTATVRKRRRIMRRLDELGVSLNPTVFVGRMNRHAALEMALQF